MSDIAVRRPFIRIKATWHPFWDISSIEQWSGLGPVVCFASKGGKGIEVDASLDDVLAAIAEASGLAG